MKQAQCRDVTNEDQWNKIRGVTGEYKRIIDVSVVLLILAYLLTVFSPRYLFLKTIITGGDTASHYYTAEYLKEVLLPQGRISGWTQGNYAGFPILQFYFPLPFLIMVVLGYVIPLEIAFKLVTVLGTFLMPVCAYSMFRLMRCKFPVPALGAAATLPFLLNEGNSMWGGNIPSTLAGEFAYSLSMAFALLLLGNLYRDITFGNGRRWMSNALLVFLIGFTHAYPLLFVGVSSVYFLMTSRGFLFRLWYLAKVYLLAFLLLGFWIVPLLAFSPYTIPFNIVWIIHSIYEVFPKVLLPQLVAAIAGTVFVITKKLVSKAKEDHALSLSIGFLWFCVLASILLYLIAQNLGVIDIRFVPFAQISLALMAAPGLGLIGRRVRGQGALAIGIAIAALLWTDVHQKNIAAWVKWNYEGFERKPAWSQFQSITQYLRGTMNDPRVVFEHSPDHDRFGSTRAFESLPLFSNRATLEGVYMQASVSAPFVFYIQPEVSKEYSAPFPQYYYTHLNLPGALDDLKLFNVRDYIVKSKAAKEAAQRTDGYRLKRVFGDYELYEIEANPNRYVVPLDVKPVLCDSEDWHIMSFRWFADRRLRDIHVVFAPASEYRADRFAGIVTDFKNMPREKLDIRDCRVEEQIEDDRIHIRTNWIGKPLLIKVSYHPNWKARGADRIYLVSPSFMLIYPNQDEIMLYYGRSFPDIAGLVLTFIGIGCLCSCRWLAGAKTRRVSQTSQIAGASRRTRATVAMVWGLCLCLCLVVSYCLKKESALKLFNQGIMKKDKAHYEEARTLFNQVCLRSPGSALAVDSMYYKAITYYLEKKYSSGIDAFQELVDQYPSSNWVPEANYHIGLCLLYQGKATEAKAAFERVVRDYGGTPWHDYAQERLGQMQTPAAAAPDTVSETYNRGIHLFNTERCEDAKPLFREVFERFPDFEGAPQALACYALCFYKEGKWEDTIKYYTVLLERYPKHRLTEEARIHIERCRAKIEK